MIRPLLVIASFAFVACVSDPNAQPIAARSGAQTAPAGDVDMSALIGMEVNGLKFLQHCQAQTGRNYTSDAATAQALEHSFVRWSNHAHVPVAEFEVTFGRVLNASGFEIGAVGPPELRVFLVRQRSG